ncbi:MAG TPA: DEAD/DEAH box helicase [Thermoplasmata archaeon]|nr:DEAD/DEAH box helicase [Thermoplasmata archaeon]
MAEPESNVPAPARGAAQRRLDDFGLDLVVKEPAEPARPPALPGIWQVEDGFVRHPLLAPRMIRALPFQLDLARVGIQEDLLVVLPTGLGKTVIAALIAAEVLRRGSGKLLFLAPTRPLVEQHAQALGHWFGRLRRARFTGTLRKPLREGSWDGAEAIFATPEMVVNDLAAERYDLKQVGLLVFDEAHRTVGDYAYVAIAQRFRTDRPTDGRVLALTASPGGKHERIEEVVGALGVARVEARSRDDPGVREYVQPVEISYSFVKLPPVMLDLREKIFSSIREEGHKLQKMGFLRKKPLVSLTVKDLIALRGEIFARPGPMTRKFGPLFHQLILLHLHHALERLETQGVEPFLQYLDRVGEKPKPSRGDRALLKLPLIEAAREEARRYLRETKEASHPKLDALVKFVEQELAGSRARPARLLVFAQYRDTIQSIQRTLEARGIRVARFVGQATRDAEDPGMSQKEQSAVLEGFRAGQFPVMVASSVAEEGLDIPDVDVVLFFESVPSEIRAIQRRGRTGRSSVGRVVVLLTEDTRDVGYMKAEARRERAMGRIVRQLGARGRRGDLADGSHPAPESRTSDEAPAARPPPARRGRSPERV